MLERYHRAINRIGGATEFFNLPEHVKKILKETTDLESKTKMMEAIADALEQEKIWSLDEIKKAGWDGEFKVVCKSGNEYDASYSAHFKKMFFAVPCKEIIIGYRKIKKA